tara:strand:+ start:28 stop:558 length:531 start_codon:yes stop_codon:yes gene_type:complete
VKLPDTVKQQLIHYFIEYVNNIYYIYMPIYTPDEYKEKLNAVSISYSSLLNKDSYGNVEENCNPSVPDSDACARLDTYKHNLMSVGDDFFHIKESIFKDIEELIEGVNVNDEKISNYNQENKDLNEKYISLRDKINGAKGMQGDIQKRYNQAYYGNIIIMLSIISGFVFYSGTRKL